MKTCLDVHNDIEAMRPSSTEFSFSQRSKWIDANCLRLYRDFGVIKRCDIQLTTVLLSYDLTTGSTQLEIDNVSRIHITSTKTTASTDITDTSLFDEYTLTQYLDPTEPTNIKFDAYFDDERIMRVQYLAVPAPFPTTSSDSTSTPDMDPEILPAIEYATLSRICKSGDAPDVQLANAYEQDFQEEVRRLKAALRNRSRRMAENRVSYREWEWE